MTSTLNNYDQRRMLANSIILVDSLNRAGYRSIDIALQARGHPVRIKLVCHHAEIRYAT